MDETVPDVVCLADCSSLLFDLSSLVFVAILVVVGAVDGTE